MNIALSLKRTALTLAVSMALAACAAGPEFKHPDAPATAQYTDGALAAVSASVAGEPTQHLAIGEKITADWWTLFQSEDLNRLIQRAIAGNQSLAATQAAVSQAQAISAAKSGGRYPQVDLNAGVGRQKYGSQFLGSIAPPPPFTYFSVGPAISYALDYTGGVGRSIEQQQALAEYQQHQFEAAYLALTGNVVMQAMSIAAIQAEIATTEELLNDDRRNVDMVQSAFEAGSISRVDVLSAQSQLAKDETLLPPLHQQLSVARHALAILLGQAPAEAVPNFQLSAFTLPQALPVQLPSELVHQRPDILAAESQLHAATAAVGVATSNLYPRITLSASFSQQSLEAGELFNASNRAWSLISGLSAPLFDGGRLRAEERAAKAALQADAARYRQTVLESFGQVADALDALNHAAEQLQAQSQALAVAQQNLELSRESFNEGNSGILQVLDSERAYQQARLGYVRAQAERLENTARLFLALGGTPPNGAAATVASK